MEIPCYAYPLQERHGATIPSKVRRATICSDKLTSEKPVLQVVSRIDSQGIS
jgi:hypothetical protein